jgi:uncharacterized RDD family membrane protein YckC
MTTGAGYRSYSGDDMVTGEGVSVELPVAGVALRAASGVIDLCVAAVALIVGAITIGVVFAEPSDAVSRTLLILLIVGATVGVPTLLETLTRGRTLGKLVFGLRVVRDDGGPVTLRHSLTRALVGWVEIYLLLGSAAMIAAIISPRAKRLGDTAAGTYVVTQRASMRLLPPPQMPAPLAAWATHADVATLPPGLAIAVRQFLGRAGGLTPRSRQVLGQELLDAVLPHVAPPPPPGVHPEYVLAAVIAERRRRDTERLAREDARRRTLLPGDPLGA